MMKNEVLDRDLPPVSPLPSAHHHPKTISGELKKQMNVIFKKNNKKTKREVISGAEYTTTLALTHSRCCLVDQTAQ